MVVYSVDKFVNWNKGKQDNIRKIHQERTDNTYKCKCGHSVEIRPYIKKTLCHWCNRWVFRDKKDEFMYRLEEQRKKLK